MPGPMKLVGARVKRVEDPRFLLGKGRYVGDLVLPRMAEMAILQSPHAHARIKRIDTKKACRAPGVLAVFTSADLQGKARSLRAAELDPERHPNYKISDWPLLAADKVRHVGDLVAVVVAESRYAAEDAAELITVDYDPLEPVVDPERALIDKRNLVHEHWENNILAHNDFNVGDVDGAFTRADVVVRQYFRTNRHHAVPLEPRGCAATYEPATGDLTLWTSSQIPHIVRTHVAKHLDRPENKVRAIAPDVGGGFGLKGHCFVEELLTAFVATQIRRPVRWLEDRQESFLASLHAKDEILDAERHPPHLVISRLPSQRYGSAIAPSTCSPSEREIRPIHKPGGSSSRILVTASTGTSQISKLISDPPAPTRSIAGWTSSIDQIR